MREANSNSRRPVPLARAVPLHQPRILMLALWPEHEQRACAILSHILNDRRRLRWLVLAISRSRMIVDDNPSNTRFLFQLNPPNQKIAPGRRGRRRRNLGYHRPGVY